MYVNASNRICLRLESETCNSTQNCGLRFRLYCQDHREHNCNGFVQAKEKLLNVYETINRKYSDEVALTAHNNLLRKDKAQKSPNKQKTSREMFSALKLRVESSTLLKRNQEKE